MQNVVTYTITIFKFVDNYRLTNRKWERLTSAALTIVKDPSLTKVFLRFIIFFSFFFLYFVFIVLYLPIFY